MKISAVTTCSREGYDKYGHKMLKTFDEMWPPEVDLYLYQEDFQHGVRSDRIHTRELPEWFTSWKRRHRKNRDAHGLDESKNRKRCRLYDFRRDCVKFAHKIAALTDATDVEADILLWMDADTFTHEPVTIKWIAEQFPDRGYMAWLNRSRMYPECGFMMFRARQKHHVRFLNRLRDIYESDAVFALKETHDSYVIQHLVHTCKEEGWFDEPHNLSGAKGMLSAHPFILSRLAERLDHAKGPRKNYGRTPISEARGRKERHWR